VENEVKEIYLGDGLYGSFNGYAIELKAPRGSGNHFVVLEPEVFESLIQFAMSIGWLKVGQTLR